MIEKYAFLIFLVFIVVSLSSITYKTELETNLKVEMAKQGLVECIDPRSEVRTIWKKECPKITDDTDDTENNEVK